MDIVLVHGYNVTSTKTYGVLPARLKSLGHSIKDVYLSKYVTLDNDLSLGDVIKAFNAALTDLYGGSLSTKKFACITHSTGALVVRGWIDTYFSAHRGSIPISHLIMLAPPTAGSRLATLGKSRLSRLRSLWGVEPGLRILDALELGSAFQWELNNAWMDKGFADATGFFPSVITGQWIDKKIWDVTVPATYERGSDGVVRAAAANLNIKRFQLDEDGKVRTASMAAVPFLITPRTAHSDEAFGVIGSIPAKGDHPVLAAIERALGVKTRAEHRKLFEYFELETMKVQRVEKFYDGTPLDRYCQLVIRVTDDAANRLQDYSIELIDADGRGDRLPKGFFSHQHANAVNSEFFTYYLSFDKISQVEGKRLGVKVQSIPDSPLVLYPETRFEGPSTFVGNFLQPNQTTYLDVVMTRKLNRRVFELTKEHGYQKIDGKPGKDWI